MESTQGDDVGLLTDYGRRAARAGWRTGEVLVLVVALSLVLAACGGDSEKRDDSVKPTLADLPSDLPQHATLLLEPYDKATRFAELGTAPVSVSWSRLSDGQARPIAGPEGTSALDMPDFTTDPVYPRAALIVRNSSSAQDHLSPGDEDFWWGVDFQLDAESTAQTGPDNGDNLLQRGLWGQTAEFKAEADLRRASCVVHGAEGTLLVRARMDAQPGKWYRMRCYRGSDGLTVTVREFGDAGWGPLTSAHIGGPVGAVTFPASMPVSIGGKIDPEGELIKSATDQFNGWIANPVIAIGSTS
jgi:hypothetical protein